MDKLVEVDIPNPFVEYPDWLVLTAFERMDKQQQESCKDRYITLSKEKKKFDENTFIDILIKSHTVEETVKRCNNPYCINGKLLKDDEFLGYCGCIKNTQQQELVEKSNLPTNLRGKKINDFKAIDSFGNIDRELSNIKDRVYKKLSEFDLGTITDPCSFLFLGKTLRGKTHLASAIANLYLAKGISVKYLNYESFMPELKKNIKDTNYQDRVFKSLTTVTVLFIDDLFSVKVSESDVSYIYRILNARANQKLPVIITSRIMYEDISKFYPSVFGRLYELVPKESIFVFKDDKQLNF